MGLDMTLYRRVRLDGSMKLAGEHETRLKEIIEREDTNPHYEVKNAVAQWRKFNALHKYFRDNFLDEDRPDNLTDMFMDISDIRELVEKLEKLLATIKLDSDGNIVDTTECEEVLPTEDGFFFGSTEYDKYYKEDIVDTIKQLGVVISEHEQLVALGVSEIDISYVYVAWY